MKDKAKALREVKARIREALKDGTPIKISPDFVVFQGTHTIRFEFASEDVAISGEARARVG